METKRFALSKQYMVLTDFKHKKLDVYYLTGFNVILIIILTVHEKQH